MMCIIVRCPRCEAAAKRKRVGDLARLDGATCVSNALKRARAAICLDFRSPFRHSGQLSGLPEGRDTRQGCMEESVRQGGRLGPLTTISRAGGGNVTSHRAPRLQQSQHSTAQHSTSKQSSRIMEVQMFQELAVVRARPFPRPACPASASFPGSALPLLGPRPGFCRGYQRLVGLPQSSNPPGPPPIHPSRSDGSLVLRDARRTAAVVHILPSSSNLRGRILALPAHHCLSHCASSSVQ
jgi:hypothetical protein